MKIRLKNIVTSRNKTINNDFNGEILYVDISSVSQDVGIIKKTSMDISEAPSRAKKIVRNNDIIISNVRTYLKSIALVKNPEKNLVVSTGFSVFIPKKNCNPLFLNYLLKNDSFHNEVIKKSKGVSYPAINTSELLDINLNIDLENQDKIASFLDENCEKIKTEISLLEKKSKLLEEYKQSLIFETVTKGLDKNAKMKDSGVDWIGEIPEHWNVKKLKSIVKTLSKSNIPSGDSEDGSFKFYVSGRKIKSIDKYNLSQKAILLPTGGTFMVHFNDDEKSAYSTDVLPIVSSKKNLDIKYLYYYLYSLEKYFHEKLFYGTGLKHLNRKGLLSEIIYLPHISEQKKITDFLNIETLKIENNINLINRKIELLKEYKQSLIHEAVTGQLEI